MAASAWGSLSGANVLIWMGIALCTTQSAILSGLNVAIFSVSKLRLEVEVTGGNRDASVLLDLRKDSNLTLAAVLWGNVTIHYRHRHHAKRNHSVTEIAPTIKLPRTGIGNCGHQPSDLIFSKWPRRGAVAFGRAPTLRSLRRGH
jgi:hypothetical protein